MKVPKKNFLPEKKYPYELISNQSVLMAVVQERFEHWGYLVYSDITSKLISFALTHRDKISEN